MKSPDQAATELYREALMRHAHAPRDAGLPPESERQALRHNPLCGDRVTVGLAFDGPRIAAQGFEAEGCALLRASASIMMGAIAGQGQAAAGALCTQVLSAWGEGGGALPEPLALLEPARFFPARLSCLRLPWEALAECLEGRGEGPEGGEGALNPP